MIDQCALSNAFSLFDEGAYAQAEALLHPLREEAEMNDPALPNILLLMTHVESALKKFPTARTCGHQLLDSSV